MNLNIINFNYIKNIILYTIIAVIIFEIYRVFTKQLDIGKSPFKFFSKKLKDPAFVIEFFLMIIIYITIIFYKYKDPDNKIINRYFKAAHLGVIFFISIVMAQLSFTTTQFFIVAFFLIIFGFDI